jgi:hypothetical protein
MCQIFKSPVPTIMLTELLQKIAVKHNNKYIFNKNAYKKGLFDNSIQEFIEKCKPYYHLSKQIYLDKKLTYNVITTIIRQICKYNNVTFTSQIKYDKSVYEIVYYIYE